MSVRAAAAGRVALVCLAGLLACGPCRAQYAPAAVEVRLPAAAELWFDGVPAPSAGERRTFTTPPLRPGLRYRYEVQVRWHEGGRDVVRGEHVIVRAGDAVLVDFTRPGGEGGGLDHMAIRDIARPPAVGRVVPAAHDPAADVSVRPSARRPLPGHMAVLEFDPRRGAPAPELPQLPPYMSIVEFDTPRR